MTNPDLRRRIRRTFDRLIKRAIERGQTRKAGLARARGVLSKYQLRAR